MTREQNATYYTHLAIRTGSNAVGRILDGNTVQAQELAQNAAKFAFAAYPELREV